MKTLIKNIGIYQNGEIQEHKNIAIIDTRIADFPTNAAEFTYDEVLEGNQYLALPGFVNTHTHVAMTMFRSYADDMQLMDWLQKKIWPAEEKLTGDIVYWGSLLAIGEMLRGGTTAFSDMYFFMDDVAKAVEETGIRAVLARGLAGVSPNGSAALEENTALYKKWHGQADGRIEVMFGPHAPYTCPPDYIKKVVTAAQAVGAEIHIHLAETKGEVNQCIKEYGKTPIALMNDLGVFDGGCLAAHCVWITEEDMKIMAAKHVRVAHNPGSNLKLASGIAPVQQMLEHGITVGLGTDGASSNNNLDMVEEMHLAALIHKAKRLDPLVIPARTAVDMLTVNGAKALGYSDIGELKIGYRADITLIDRSGLHWYPQNDMVSLLAYAANSFDVDTALVNGKIVLRNKKLLTIDEERVIFEVERCKKLLFQ